MTPETRADVPKNDRELLLQIHQDMQHVRQKIDGPDGLCAVQRQQSERIGALENWRYYTIGVASLAGFLAGLGVAAWGKI